MASTPQFTGTPRIASVQMTAANTARDGSGTLYTLDTGHANGTLVSWIAFQAITTTSAGTLRIFVNGQLFQEIATQGATPSGTTPAEAHAVVFAFPQQLVLGDGQELQVATNNAETWNALGFMGDF